MFHSASLFWRVHMMHHADLDCDVTTGFRFHPLEVALSMGIKLAAVVVLGAAFLTELLPTDVQRAIFHGPVLIAVLIAGTAFLLWRISRGRPA